MQSLEDEKYLLIKKSCYSFQKKSQNVSTDLTTESVHPLGAFQTFSVFTEYNKAICVSKFF